MPFSGGIVDSHADLFLAGEAKPQRAAAAIGQGEAAGVELVEVRRDDFSEFGLIVDLRHEVDFDLGSRPAQNAVALSELPEVVMVVAEIVVGGLEGREEPVEQVPGPNNDLADGGVFGPGAVDVFEVVGPMVAGVVA